MPFYHYFYKQFIDNAHVRSLEEMENFRDGIQWFALEPNYGEAYGPISYKYKVIRPPHLIDLGKTRNRQKIIQKLKLKEPNIAFLLNPDEQYSGVKSNKVLHQILKKYYSKYYDGTIIVDPLADEENKGPTEVVIWHNHSKFLRKV